MPVETRSIGRRMEQENPPSSSVSWIKDYSMTTQTFCQCDASRMQLSSSGTDRYACTRSLSLVVKSRLIPYPRRVSRRHHYLVNPTHARNGHGGLGRGLLRKDGNSPVHHPNISLLENPQLEHASPVSVFCRRYDSLMPLGPKRSSQTGTRE